MAPGLAPERSQRAHQSPASGSPARLGRPQLERRGLAPLVDHPRHELARAPRAGSPRGSRRRGRGARRSRTGPARSTRSGWVAASIVAAEPPSETPKTDRPLDAHGVQHRERVVDDVLQRVGAPVGEAHAALVERDHPRERPEPLEERCASASSTPISRWLTKPLMNSRSTGPSPRTGRRSRRRRCGRSESAPSPRHRPAYPAFAETPALEVGLRRRWGNR